MAEHVTHAARFAAAAPDPPADALDLGAGGGVPGLVLARTWPASRWVLLDVHLRRTAFLTSAVVELELDDRVRVVRSRAEEAGRDDSLRGHFDLVTARSFGPPAVTAECGAPFLRLDGSLLVSEPPHGGDRWPADALAPLGLAPDAQVAGIQVLRLDRLPESRFPRTAAAMKRRPLF